MHLNYFNAVFVSENIGSPPLAVTAVRNHRSYFVHGPPLSANLTAQITIRLYKLFHRAYPGRIHLGQLLTG